MGGCFSRNADGPQKSRYPSNKVVPEDTHPQGKPADITAAVAWKEISNEGEQCKSHAMPKGQTCHGTSGSHANSVQPAAALKQQPVLKQLVDACSSAGPKTATRDAAALRALQGKVTGALTGSHASPVPKDTLEACVSACSGYIQRMLGPVVASTERMLSKGTAPSAPGSASTAKGTSWDTMEVGELLDAFTQSMDAVYNTPATRTAACGAAGVAADILAVIKASAAQPQGSRVALHLFSVPCVNSLASMLGVIFFRKVVLETQAALDAKADALSTLLSTLQWQPSQLGACLEPHAAAMLMSVQHAASHGEARAKFTVRRNAAFWDSLPQALDQGLLGDPGASSDAGPRRTEVLVFPSFVDEWAAAAAGAGGAAVAVESGEGHGPRKEFFTLAGADMVGSRWSGPGSGTGTGSAPPPAGEPAGAGRPALFTYNRTAGCYWVNTTLAESPELRRAFTLAGWLLAQSLLTKAPLGVPLPPLLLHQLLHGPDSLSPDLPLLEQFDPAAAQGVRSALALPPDQLRDMLELEGLPASMSAQEYAAHAVKALLVGDVEWQVGAMKRGLGGVMDSRLWQAWGLGPDAVAAAVAGGGGEGAGGKVDVRKVFRVALDSELTGGKGGGVLGELLWEVLDSWPPERVTSFLAFVTGSTRLPVPGMELLRVEAPFVAFGAAQHKTQLGMLPQAHTCDNLLELPNYWEALLHVRGHSATAAALPPDVLAALRLECRAILDDRLTLAVTSFSGYGLDERDGDASGFGGGGGGSGSGVGGGVGPGFLGVAESDFVVPAKTQAQAQAQARGGKEEEGVRVSLPELQAPAAVGTSAPASPSGGDVVLFSHPLAGDLDDDDVVELGPEFGLMSSGEPVAEAVWVKGGAAAAPAAPILLTSAGVKGGVKAGTGVNAAVPAAPIPLLARARVEAEIPDSFARLAPPGAGAPGAGWVAAGEPRQQTLQLRVGAGVGAGAVAAHESDDLQALLDEFEDL